MSAEVIADEPCYVWAIKIREGGEEKVIIRHSLLLTEDDPIFQEYMHPVEEVLDQSCSEKTDEREEDDEGFMWARVQVIEYRRLRGCPGDLVDHRCVGGAA